MALVFVRCFLWRWGTCRYRSILRIKVSCIVLHVVVTCSRSILLYPYTGRLLCHWQICITSMAVEFNVVMFYIINDNPSPYCNQVGAMEDNSHLTISLVLNNPRTWVHFITLACDFHFGSITIQSASLGKSHLSSTFKEI